MATNFIKKAIKHPGAFSAKAKAAGMATLAYAHKVMGEKSGMSTTTKREASLAITLAKLQKRKRHV